MRWIWRGSALAALLNGWVFIAWQNHFHITAPFVFVCLGYLAVVATVYNLWRTGAAAVASSEDEGDSTWAKPAGALGELEREKRTLIKAIKEAEFDHQMGKLSQRDADDMIRTYRARAVEVMKEIDQLELGAAGSAREQILREVRARIAIDAKSQRKPVTEPKPERAKGKKQSLAEKAAAPAEPVSPAADAATKAGASASSPGTDAATPADDPAAKAAEPAEGPDSEAGSLGSMTRGAATTMLDEETMNADSTTAIEPKRDDPATEAVP
jgi:hypothetical protein